MTLRSTTMQGGGWCRLLYAVIAVPVLSASSALAVSALPYDEGALVSFVKEAIEARDLSALDALVDWSGVDRHDRRLITMQLRHTLGRPVRNIALEAADPATRTDLEHFRDHHLNLPVTHLLRITFSDAPEDADLPSAVFLIGTSEGRYRIALLTKAASDAAAH